MGNAKVTETEVQLDFSSSYVAVAQDIRNALTMYGARLSAEGDRIIIHGLTGWMYLDDAFREGATNANP